MSTMPPPPSMPAQQRTGRYASWGSRAVAYIIDGAIASIPSLLAVIVLVAATGDLSIDADTGDLSGSGTSAGLVFLAIILYLGTFVFAIWNQGWRQGTTGQSIGKGIMKISVITEDGRFMGGGLGIGRMLLNGILGGACLLNYLWPLWDDKVQTWADKIVNTIVVEA